MGKSDEVRRMLDERGIEYNVVGPDEFGKVVYFDLPDGREVGFTDFYDGHTQLRIWDCTPTQAIAATMGMEKWEPSKEWKAWHNSLKHDNPTSIREAVENILYEAIDFGGDMGPNGNVWCGVDEGIVLTENCIDGWVESVESISATAGMIEEEADSRDLMEAIRDDDGVRYSMDEVMDIMRKDVAATVGRSCASCPEMDNPDSYISHLQSALKWHDEHVPRPTNPINTCVVLEGEKVPEEVLFIGANGVTHYLPEATCRNDGFKDDGEWYFVCSGCGCEFEYTNFACEFAEGHGLGSPKYCPNCRARVVAE